MPELKDTPAKDLDRFIENYLLPDTQFRRQVKEAIHIISTFLKERCFQGAAHPVRVSKVVKVSPSLPGGGGGGWMGKSSHRDREREQKVK